MQHNPVGWFEIYVQDPELTKSFYEAVFQTTLTHMANAGVDLWCFPMHNGGCRTIRRAGDSGVLHLREL
jgi:predicted enzyme related to lactoylglutathione lyase